jgi:transglutaminase-like putative cysteine protease
METFLRAGYRTVRWLGAANVIAVCLLAIAFASLVFGVQTTMRGLDAWPLFFIALAGIIFGWILAGARTKGWVAVCLAFVVGGTIVFLGIGRLARPLGRLIFATAGWFGQIFQLGPFLPKSFTLPEYPALYQTWSGLILAIRTTGERASAWVQALVAGRPIYDPLSVMIVWGLITWGAVVWAAWWIRRRQQPFIALAPCGILLTINLAYSGGAIYALIVWIGAMVCLQAIGSYFHQERDWQAHHLDRAGIEGDWSLAVGFLALTLMSVALFAPSVSIQKIADQIEQVTNPQTQTSNNLAQALGIRQRIKVANEPLDLAQNPGLPNEHLLGSGPQLSKEVVMWVKLDGYNPMPRELLAVQPDLGPPRYYWRGATYDHYTGRGWTSVPQSTKTISGGHSIADQLFWWSEAPYQMIRQDIQMTNDQEGLLFAAGELLQVSKDYKVAWHGPWDMFGAQVESGNYTADSRLGRPTPRQLSQASEDYPDWVLRTYLAVPESVPRRVWELALDLTASLPTPYDKAVAIESYLRKFPYTLDLGAPPPDRDIVDYFLFDLQRGYCDYYASAMVVLARAAGLPARLVTGYASGAYVPEEARFVVTQADAHTWPEIYFPGYGWVEFEPTAGRPPIERPETPEQQAAQIKTQSPLLPPESRPINQARKIILGVLIALGVGLLLLATWWLGDRLRLGWLAPPEAITLLYSRLYRRGRPFEAHSPPGDTPHEFAAKFSQRLTALLPLRSQPWALERILERVRRLVEAYTQVVYSPHPANEAEKRSLIQDWQNLRFPLWQARWRKITHHDKQGKQK